MGPGEFFLFNHYDKFKLIDTSTHDFPLLQNGKLYVDYLHEY